jgi:hypothetical protein
MTQILFILLASLLYSIKSREEIQRRDVLSFLFALRLGAHWQLNCCCDQTVAVHERALQRNSCLNWQLFFSFSTEWTSQRQHVYVLFYLE